MAKSQLAVPANARWRAQHRVDRRIGMVERNRVDAVEQRQVVLVRRIVSMPGHHVERRVIDECRPQPAEEFRGDMEFAFAIFIRRDRSLEVARIRQAVRPDRPQFRKPEGQAVVLADISARLRLLEHHAELHSSWNHADLARPYAQDPQLRVKAKRAELRNDQQLPIGRVEEAIFHRMVRSIQMDRQTRLHGRVATAAQRDNAVDEVRFLIGNGQRIPAQLVRRRRHLDKGTAANHPPRNLLVRSMRYRRSDAIGPCAPIGRPRRGKRRAAELLRIQPQRMLLRRVLALRQSAGNRFGCEFVAKSRLIRERGG